MLVLWHSWTTQQPKVINVLFGSEAKKKTYSLLYGECLFGDQYCEHYYSLFIQAFPLTKKKWGDNNNNKSISTQNKQNMTIVKRDMSVSHGRKC